jgi:YHS domain-containing protein
MFRALIEMIVTLVAVYLVRQVLAILAGAFKGGFSSGSANPTSSAGAPSPKPPAADSIGELKKDPVCGTFVSTEAAFQKAVGGQTYYFCSKECRDKYNG